MESSYPTGKGPCPNCRKKGADNSGDNLIKYSDGHSFCFACKYFERGARSFVPPSHDVEQQIRLPEDCQEDLPYEPGNWLAKYNILKSEVVSNHIKWSPSRKMLIFPFYGEDEGDLLGWQGRCFDNSNRKYHTVGHVDTIFAYQNLTEADNSGIIIVEDLVSAIKVGRYGCSLPLLGSNIPMTKRAHLRIVSDKLTIWLDYDKRAEAYRYADMMHMLGYQTLVIVTKEDPKEIDDEDLENIVKGIEYT
jgi:hypothetical protein